MLGTRGLLAGLLRQGGAARLMEGLDHDRITCSLCVEHTARQSLPGLSGPFSLAPTSGAGQVAAHVADAPEGATAVLARGRELASLDAAPDRVGVNRHQRGDGAQADARVVRRIGKGLQVRCNLACHGFAWVRVAPVEAVRK